MPKLKSAHMKPNLDPNFQSRLLQPRGFKENRSCVSKDSPEWFKPHPSIVTRATPHDPDANTNVNLFLKVTGDILNRDGSRKKRTFVAGPSGAEDTAVSAKAPEWFHVSHVPKVDTQKTSFFDPYNPDHHEPTVGTTSSADLPDWAQLPTVPKRAPRVAKAEKLWRHDYVAPEDTIRFDRDAATSLEAPDFFHIEGVPRARPNPYGGYDFDYDHGAFGKNKKGFQQQPPVQINARRHRQQQQHRGSRSPNVSPARSQNNQSRGESGRGSSSSSSSRSRSESFSGHRSQSRPSTTTGGARGCRGRRSGGGAGRALDPDRVAVQAAAKRREAERLQLQRAIKQQKHENLRLLSEHIAFREEKLQERQQRQFYSPPTGGHPAAREQGASSKRRELRAQSASPQRSTALW